MPIKKRFEFVKAQDMCINCLNRGHEISNCKASTCKTCNKRHHSLLHFINEESNIPSIEDFQNENASNTVNLHSQLNAETLLSTALISIIDSYGVSHTCRALLDCGSQSNYMTEELANRLQFRRNPVNIPILGIGNNQSTISAIINANINSKFTNF